MYLHLMTVMLPASGTVTCCVAMSMALGSCGLEARECQILTWIFIMGTETTAGDFFVVADLSPPPQLHAFWELG